MSQLPSAPPAPATRTYGTAVLRGGWWHLECEPHVTVRLRRLFGRVGPQHGTLRLKDSEEVCRDLRWVLERYPLEVTPRARLEERAARFEERAEAFAQVLSGAVAPRTFELALPPRGYQRVAADLALRAGGLLLADDVGLGKTVSAIAALSDPSARPALVVTLTHLPGQWAAELARFAPELRVHVAKKARPDLAPGADPDVIVLNYHKLSGWADALAGRVQAVVFDEVQELRRAGTAKAKAARHVAKKARLRLGLSATPVYNYGAELFNVLDVLRSGALGHRREFLREWCAGARKDDDKARIHDPRAFGTYAREQGLILRRTRAEVGRELPPLSKVPQVVPADPKALDAVADAASELARLILAENVPGFARLRAGEELSWRLRQATGIAKAPYVAELVRLLVEGGEQVVLYGWHREVHALWAERLADLGPVFFTGSESPAQKERARAAFLRGEARVLVMSLRAGAGLDGLQGACRTVVFGELDWSPGVHEQCIGRVHRDGQPEPVVAYFPLAERGSDPVVADVLGVKRAQAGGLLDPHADLIESLSSVPDRLARLAEDYLKQRRQTA